MPSFLNPNGQTVAHHLDPTKSNPISKDEQSGSTSTSSTSSTSNFPTSLSDFRLPGSSSNCSSSRTVYGFSSSSNPIASSPIAGSDETGDSRSRTLARRAGLLPGRDSERPSRDKDRWKGKEKEKGSNIGNVRDSGQRDSVMEDNKEEGRSANPRADRDTSPSSQPTIFRPRLSNSNQQRPRPLIPFRSSSPSPRAHTISNQQPLSSFSDMRRPRSFSGSSDIASDAMQIDLDEDTSGELKPSGNGGKGGSGGSSRPSTPPANDTSTSTSTGSTSSKRPLGRKFNTLLPRDKSVLRVAATLKDESKPEDSELASEAKLQRRLGELSLPTSPVARSASASSGFEKGAGMWGWGRAASPFAERLGSSRRSIIDGDLDGLAFGLGYGNSEDGMIESDNSSDGLEVDSIAPPSERSSSVPPNPTQPQLINPLNHSHHHHNQLQSQQLNHTNLESEVEMMDGCHPSSRSFGAGSSLPSTSAGRGSSLWTGFRDGRRSRTPGASVLSSASAHASPGIGQGGRSSSDSMDVEGIVAGLERSVKRKYVSEERFEPYANSANKRRAVSPSLSLALGRTTNFSSNSPGRREDYGNASNGVPMASPSLLATPSYFHGSSPLHISTTSSGSNLPIPTPLSIPSPTNGFGNAVNSNSSSAATHYFSSNHLSHRRSSSATSLKDIAPASFNPNETPSSGIRSSDSPATRPSTPVPPSSSSLAVSTTNPSGSASAGPSPSLLATSAGSGSGPGYIRSGALGLSLSGNSKARKGNRRRSTNPGTGLGLRSSSGASGSDLLDDDQEGEEMDEGVRMLGLG